MFEIVGYCVAVTGIMVYIIANYVIKKGQDGQVLRLVRPGVKQIDPSRNKYQISLSICRSYSTNYAPVFEVATYTPNVRRVKSVLA